MSLTRGRAGRGLGNRGVGPLALSVAICVVAVALLIGQSMLTLSQSRAGAREREVMLANDVANSAVEVLNELLVAGTVQGFNAKYPETAATDNTYYLRAKGTSVDGAVTVGGAIGLSWSFTNGYVQSSGAPAARLAQFSVTNCDPRRFAFGSIFSASPAIPASCATAKATVAILNAKNGSFLEVDSNCQLARAGRSTAPADDPVYAGLVFPIANFSAAPVVARIRRQIPLPRKSPAP